MVDTLLVLSSGPFTTVQDRGRYGYQQMGIPVSGALDAYACCVANLLVGNAQGAAVLESTLVGPQLAILKAVDIALTGAEMGAKLNYQPIENWQTIHVKPGDVLTFQPVKRGCRGYLAVSGGIQVPEVMRSRSTYAGGKIGGYRGRALKKGDIIKCDHAAPLEAVRRLPEKWIPRYCDTLTLRTIAGPQDDHFDEGLVTLFQSEYRVTSQADRMGYRLQGAPIEQKEGMPQSIISEPSVPGGIQVPAERQPIVLFVEQTVGGYAKIATVISSDLSLLAQAVPGDSVRFESVDLEIAHRIYKEETDRLTRIVGFLSR